MACVFVSEETDLGARFRRIGGPETPSVPREVQQAQSPAKDIQIRSLFYAIGRGRLSTKNPWNGTIVDFDFDILDHSGNLKLVFRFRLSVEQLVYLNDRR